MTTTHVIRLAAPYYDALEEGHKNFEVRRNDRGYQAEDLLILVDAARCQCTSPGCAAHRPRLQRRVTYVYSGDPRFGGGLTPGFVVLGLATVAERIVDEQPQ